MFCFLVPIIKPNWIFCRKVSGPPVRIPRRSCKSEKRQPESVKEQWPMHSLSRCRLNLLSSHRSDCSLVDGKRELKL